MRSTNTKPKPVDPRLANVPPGRPRDVAAGELQSYDSKAARHRSELLPPGGVRVEAGRGPTLEWISPAVPAQPLLERCAQWWNDATATGARLLDDAEADSDLYSILTAVAADLLSEVVRARIGILTALAAAMLPGGGPESPVSPNGTVTVGRHLISLTGAAAGGPNPRIPVVHFNIEAGSDPDDVAKYLRDLAAQIEENGSY